MIQKTSPTIIWMIAFNCGLFWINEWQLELFASAIITAFVWSFTTLNKTNKWQIPNAWPLKIIGAFWLLTFLSVLGSDILSVSLMAFCLFSMMPLTFLTLVISGHRHDFTNILKMGATIYALLALWGLVQFFIFGDYFDGRAHHPLSNPNSLSALLSLGFFCALGWKIGSHNTKQKYIALFLCIILFGGIMVSGSRGALYALLIMLIPFLWIMREQLKNQYRSLLILTATCLSFFILTAWGTDINESLFNRLILDTQAFQDTQAQSLNQFSNNRISIWSASFDMIKQHGIFGTGIGTYFLYFPEFRLSNDPKGTYYAHSDPLQYWVELGILGPILFYTFIISMAGRTIQAIKKTTTSQQKLSILTPFFALGAMVVHTHVTFNLYNLSIVFVSGFLLALWFFATQQVLKTKTTQIIFPPSYPLWTKPLFIAMPFIIIGSIFTAYVAGEHFNNKARDHMLAGEIEEFTADVLRAQKIGLNGNYRPYLLAVNVPLSLLEDQNSHLDLAQKKEITAMALNYIQHVQNINPRSSSAYYYMGRLIDIDKEQNLPNTLLPNTLGPAQYYYHKAIQLDPLHIGARLALAKTLTQQDKQEEALEILEQGAQYKYITENAIKLYAELARIYLKNGNTEKRDLYIQKIHRFQKLINRQMEKDKKTLKTHLFHNSKAQINQ